MQSIMAFILCLSILNSVFAEGAKKDAPKTQGVFGQGFAGATQTETRIERSVDQNGKMTIKKYVNGQLVETKVEEGHDISALMTKMNVNQGNTGTTQTNTRVERQIDQNGKMTIKTFVNGQLVDTKVEEGHDISAMMGKMNVNQGNTGATQTETRIERSVDQNGKMTIKKYVNGQLVETKVEEGHDISALMAKNANMKEIQSSLQPTQQIQTKRIETEIGPDGTKTIRTYIDGKLVETKVEKPNVPTAKLVPEKQTVPDFNKILTDTLRPSQAPSGPQDKVLAEMADGRLLANIADLVMAKLNTYRESKGLNRLETDTELRVLCVRHSTDMASTEKLSHDGFPARVHDNLSYQSKCSAENVGYVMNVDYTQANEWAEHLMKGWKNSAGHNKNMLKENVTNANVGLARMGHKFFATMILTSPKCKLDKI